MAYIYKTGRIELFEQIKKHSHFIKGKVLDIGAGNYSRYKSLFDYSEYIKMNIIPSENTDIVGKIESIPFENNTIDSIICTQVLGDVYDLKKAFSEMHRILKVNGTILVTENLFDTLHDEPFDFWRFTEHSLRKLAENSGFKIKILEKRGGYWSLMSQLKSRYWIERLNANKKWFAPILSKILKIHGVLSIFIDRIDKSRANKLFTHGYILIAQKC